MDQQTPDSHDDLTSGFLEPWRRHRLWGDRLFLSLPPKLLNALDRERVSPRFDPDVLSLERAVSRACGDHTAHIGFWGSGCIDYRFLAPPASTASYASRVLAAPARIARLLRRWRKNEVQVGHVLEAGDRRLAWATNAGSAYCGWLLSNPQFLEEHDALFENRMFVCREHGIPKRQLTNLSDLPEEYKPYFQPPDSFGAAAAKDFSTFFDRWRLQGMAAPYLPEPLSARLPVIGLALVTNQMLAGGRVFYLPDILPVLGNNDLRLILEDILRSRTAPEHLAGWMRIVRASNSAKNQMVALARRFQLDHFWRVLHLRHAAALDRQIQRLEYAFAAFLGVNVSSVHHYLGQIAKARGADWYRHQPLLAQL